MNKNMSEEILKSMKSVNRWIKSAENIASEQAPEIVKQMVRARGIDLYYVQVRNGLWAMMWLSACSVVGYFSWVNQLPTPDGGNYRLTDAQDCIWWFMLLGRLGTVATFIGFLVMADDFISVAGDMSALRAAPKAWLAREIASILNPAPCDKEQS